MKNIWSIILICLICFFTACEKSGIISHPKPILSVIGSISPHSGVQVQLNRTYTPEGEFYDKNTKWTVENAIVELWEEEKKVNTLLHQSNGIYKLPNTSWKPTVGKSYFIKATASGFAPIESEKVILPTFKGNIKHTYKYNKTGSYINLGSPFLNVGFSFQDDNTSNNTYYVTMNITKNGTTDGISGVADITPNIASSNQVLACGIFSVVYRDFCFKNTCFQGQYYTHDFGVEITHSDFKTHKQSEADRVDIQVAQVSNAWYNYLHKIHLNDALRWEYREPYIGYTNIKGGIGIFYGKNEYSFTIKL